jgi:GT2 family glycosyltransferase
MKQISFLINTSVNTLDHVKLLLRSLKENLVGAEHEILVFVDSDNEGTVEYLKEQKKDFFDLKIITHRLNPCIGYSRNNNLLVELAKHDIVSYLQSDMVISPEYDLNVLSDLEDNCILSATRIEPPLHGASYQTITKDFGTDPNEFKWNEFQKFSVEAKNDREIEYFFAPFTFYKKVWMDVGGYDTLFRRSREDSDLLQRFIQAGIKIKQTFKANVYHFSCVSSRGKNWFDPNSEEAKQRVATQNIADQVELTRFIRKWGRFNHGEEKILRYDMDLVWVGGSLDDLVKIEHFFNKIWVPTQEIKDELLGFYNTRNEHQYANHLLKFSNEDWNNAKKFYNQTDYESLVQVGKPGKFNIKIEIDMTRDSKGTLLKDGNVLLSNLGFLSDLIAPCEPGIYELGCAEFHVITKVNLGNSHIVVENPPFDHSLLTIE